MQPLSPIQVYVPVSAMDEMPEKEGIYFALDDTGKWLSNMHPKVIPPMFLRKGKKWLKEQSLYVFDRKELEGLLGDAFDAATDENVYPDSSCGRGVGGQTITSRPKWKDKSEYLKSILP